MIYVQAIRAAKPVHTPDWPGDKMRIDVNADAARIELDLDARIVVLRPLRGKTVCIPMENIVSWHPYDETNPRPEAKPVAPEPTPAAPTLPAPVAPAPQSLSATPNAPKPAMTPPPTPAHAPAPAASAPKASRSTRQPRSGNT